MKANHLLMHHNRSAMLGSMGECMDKAIHEGYTTDFAVKHGKLVSSEGCKEYGCADVTVRNYYVPGDEDFLATNAMYLVETTDGTKGILVDTNGAFFENDISRFIKKSELVQLKK